MNNSTYKIVAVVYGKYLIRKYIEYDETYMASHWGTPKVYYEVQLPCAVRCTRTRWTLHEAIKAAEHWHRINK